MSNRGKLFVLYDARAWTEDGEDDASVFSSASSERETREDSRAFSGTGGVWWEYDTKGNNMLNGRMRADLHQDILSAKEPPR